MYLDFDIRLCQRLQEGDEGAYTEAFERYSKLLYALAYRFLKSGAEAEDAVQYTFMKVWEERRRLDFSTGIRSLLYTVMKNYVLNELRHRSIVFEKHYLLAQEREEADESFLKEYEDRNLREILLLAIDKLPSQKSIICKLKLMKGMSNQEIANKMNIEVVTVKSHYTQAIKMLRHEFIAILLVCICC